ncbi:hypothetical protein ACYG9R_20755 [Mesorhizobium sp. RSR565B]
MKPKLVNQVSGQRIFVVVLDLGDEGFAALTPSQPTRTSPTRTSAVPL